MAYITSLGTYTGGKTKQNVRILSGVITTTGGKVTIKEMRPYTQSPISAYLLCMKKKNKSFRFFNWKRRTWIRSLRRYEKQA